MIYSLRGKLIMAQPGVIVVECGGVGYKCAVSLTTLSMLPNKGSEVFVVFIYYSALREIYSFKEGLLDVGKRFKIIGVVKLKICEHGDVRQKVKEGILILTRFVYKNLPLAVNIR